MTTATSTDVSDKRRESLGIAASLGATAEALAAIAAARRVSSKPTITLPGGRYSHCSRASGWARCGSGPDAEWGEKVDGGYRVGPGEWLVHSSDGFARHESAAWAVRHVAVGTKTWTIAD